MILSHSLLVLSSLSLSPSSSSSISSPILCSYLLFLLLAMIFVTLFSYFYFPIPQISVHVFMSTKLQTCRSESLVSRSRSMPCWGEGQEN
ncbi:hypothetical protein RchiOBHm_Chr6g0310321 [Rosa chinensis]|uniref:Uncharacterized protein n=1 Tax=Rosa chinensis TaxID=74649 RepID=A0A2P6Q151_ROSCH|nr:hypothetical protein RchiOBHm_Chr6g0310321 [Rosa chinensis]